MNKTIARLIAVTGLGIGLLFLGMFYSYLETQGLIAFGQNTFGKIAIELNFESDSTTPATFDTVGLSPTLLRRLNKKALSTSDWQQIFPVRLVDENVSSSQPMLGGYMIEANKIHFLPRFPLIAGQQYQATFSFDALPVLDPILANSIPADLQDQTIIANFSLPRAEIPTTEVTAIYPTADELPENLLRFYLYFSASMREGDVLDKIQLVDGQGQEVEGVFFDPVFELWDPSMQRLTLLFDPGRVKTGLRAHEELGRALVPGESYKLVIGEGLVDAYGNPLAQPFEKAFAVVEADLTPPDVDSWQTELPQAGSREPLVIHFPAPLDHALLTEFVRVQNSNGKLIAGKVELENHETLWRFVPAELWRADTYELVVETRLEDIAGNNLHGLFDTPPEERLSLMDRAEVIFPLQIE